MLMRPVSTRGCRPPAAVCSTCSAPASPASTPLPAGSFLLHAELVTKAEEVAGLHETQRSAQSQINLYISDLQAREAVAVPQKRLWHSRGGKCRFVKQAAQSAYCMASVLINSSLQQRSIDSSTPRQAYERQVEAMQRALHRREEAADGSDRERQALLEQLRGAEQVCSCELGLVDCRAKLIPVIRNSGCCPGGRQHNVGTQRNNVCCYSFFSTSHVVSRMPPLPLAGPLPAGARPGGAAAPAASR